MQSSKIKKLCVAAVFAAVYVLLDYASELMSTALFANQIKITLSGLPVILGAILLGPLWGGLIGTVGEFIVQVIGYGLSAASLLYVIPQTVCGIAVGIFYIAAKRSDKLLPILANITLSRIILTLLNTAALYVHFVIMLKIPYTVFSMTLVIRLLTAVLTSVVLSVIISPLLKQLRKIVK